MTWENIKNQLLIMYGKYVKSGGFVEADSGDPTELALYVDLVHQEIMSHPGAPETFQRKTGTATLTGATTLDIKALYPDYVGFYDLYGVNSNMTQPYESKGTINKDLNNQGYTVINGVLHFTGGYPTTGTITFDYKSAYLVEDSSGSRKQFFTATNDVSVLPHTLIYAILTGVGEYVDWKTDNRSQAQRMLISKKAAIAMESVNLYQEKDGAIESFLS